MKKQYSEKKRVIVVESLTLKLHFAQASSVVGGSSEIPECLLNRMKMWSDGPVMLITLMNKTKGSKFRENEHTFCTAIIMGTWFLRTKQDRQNINLM